MQTPPERHSSCTWTDPCLANHHRATAELTSLMLHVPFEASSTWFFVGRFPTGDKHQNTNPKRAKKTKNTPKWWTGDLKWSSSLIIENYRENSLWILVLGNDIPSLGCHWSAWSAKKLKTIRARNFWNCKARDFDDPFDQPTQWIFRHRISLFSKRTYSYGGGVFRHCYVSLKVASINNTIRWSNIIPSILSGHNAKVTNSGDQIQEKFPQRHVVWD